MCHPPRGDCVPLYVSAVLALIFMYMPDSLMYMPDLR